MAKINFGQTVNDARGKLGGTVFSKNKGGAYTRRKVTPTNPRTTAQQAVRNNFSSLSRDWSGTLTDVQRAAWTAYAQTYPVLDIFGAAITLSGANTYIKLNARLVQIGQPKILLPPTSNVVQAIPFDPTSYTVAATNTISFQQTAVAPGGSNTRYYALAAGPLPAGRQPQNSDFRFLDDPIAAAGPYPATINFGGDYTPKYGNIASGQRISILVSTIDITTGLITSGVMMTAVA